MAKSDVERLAKLTRDREGYLSIHKTLMDAYKKTSAPRYKEMASSALDEAQKRSEKIAKILRNNGHEGRGDAE
jgi:hypothetical protein